MDYSSILSKPKSFFGKQKVWMARGEDLALFNTHRPNFQNLLRHSCIPESSHNLWIGLYRVGTTEDEAKTFVVVSCTDRRIRRLTRDILSSCPIFQPGQALDRFKVISKASLPETASEPQQTMQDEQNSENEPGLWNGDKGKNIARDEYKTIRISPSITGDSYLCRQLQARHISSKGEVRYQTATAGPLINVDGRTYQLTVAHVVNFETKDIHDTIESTTEDWDDWDEESDDDVNSGCSVDEDAASWDISASRNSTPDASDNGIPSSSSSNSAFEVTTQQEVSGAAMKEATSPNEITIDKPVHPPSSTHPHLSEHPILEEFLIDHASPYLGFAPRSENCQISMEMDYLLIPINADLQARACTSKSAELIQMSETLDLQGKTEPRPVIIATASVGYVGGVIFPAPSLLRPPGSKDFQTLYCIESDSAMPKKTSGSAVFDRQTGLLAGYIVLGCPEKNIWYMALILDVLNDLEVRFHQRGKCQTRLDIDAATRLSDQSGFLNEMPPGLLGTSQVCQGGSSILMKGEYDQSMVSKPFKMAKLEDTFDKHMTSISKGSQRESPTCFDHWKSQFGHDANAPERGFLLLAQFRELKAFFFQEMAPLLPDSVKVSGIKSAAIEVGSHKRKGGLQPTAWMLDISKPFNKGKALNRRDLSETLRQQNLSPGCPDDTNDKLTCLYVKNPDPTAIIALLETTSLPMKGFQEILYNSIVTQPRAIIDLHEYTWHESHCFLLSFTLPYFTTSNRKGSDTRSAFAGTAFQSKSDLSSLKTEDRLGVTQDEISDSHTDKDHPYTSTCTVMITGVSDRYWTAVCLDDDFFDIEERPEMSEDIILVSSSSEHQTVEVKRPTPPRAYALQALAWHLERISEYHARVHLRFVATLSTFCRDENSRLKILKARPKKLMSQHNAAPKRIYFNQRVIAAIVIMAIIITLYDVVNSWPFGSVVKYLWKIL
ncbi:hypothetical protein FCOIX_7717 [Fusarium coicis]|nr:hypothetical protein FCOIX_7717 [Fusarium coicis]